MMIMLEDVKGGRVGED